MKSFSLVFSFLFLLYSAAFSAEFSSDIYSDDLYAACGGQTVNPECLDGLDDSEQENENGFIPSDASSNYLYRLSDEAEEPIMSIGFPAPKYIQDKSFDYRDDDVCGFQRAAESDRPMLSSRHALSVGAGEGHITELILQLPGYIGDTEIEVNLLDKDLQFLSSARLQGQPLHVLGEGFGSWKSVAVEIPYHRACDFFWGEGTCFIQVIYEGKTACSEVKLFEPFDPTSTGFFIDETTDGPDILEDINQACEDNECLYLLAQYVTDLSGPVDDLDCSIAHDMGTQTGNAIGQCGVEAFSNQGQQSDHFYHPDRGGDSTGSVISGESLSASSSGAPVAGGCTMSQHSSSWALVFSLLLMLGLAFYSYALRVER